MNGETPLYQGAAPQAARQQFAQVPQLPRMQMFGGQLDNAVAAGLGIADKFAELHDFGVRQEAEHRMRQNELEMQQEFERKCALAPGAEGSFFSAEGRLDEDVVAAFTDKWQQRNREVARPYWKRGNAMRGEEDVLARNDQLAGNVGLGLLRQESARREAAFRDNFDLAVAQDDMAGACRIVDDAVVSGQITSARGQVMKLGLAKRAARAEGARARRGGRESAAQFLNNFYEGFDESDEPGGAVLSGGAPGLTETQVMGVSAEGDVLAAAGLPDFNTVSGYGGVPGTKPVLALGLGGLNDDEWIDEYRDTLDVASQGVIGFMPGNPQPLSFTAPAAAPEATQAYMGQAQSRQGMTLDELRRMCYSVAWQMVENPDYKGLKDEALQKAIVGKITVPGAEGVFFADSEDPGLAAQSFFDGIAHNVMSTRDSKLDDGVDAALQGRNANAAIEKVVGGVQPSVVLQHYPDMTKYADAGREHWWRHDKENASARALEPAFQRHKERFFAETGAEPQEWSTLSSEFAEWYLGEGGGYGQDRKDYVEAVRDMCRTAATDAVVGYRRQGGENWAQEQELVREAVQQVLDGLQPDDVEVYARFNAARDARLRARAAEARERYDSDAAALDDAVRKGAAGKARREEEAKRAKEAAKDGESAVEREIHRFRFPVQSEVRLAGGDLRGRIDTDEPTVYVPHTMYEAIKSDLGAGDGVVCVFGGGRTQFLVKPSLVAEKVELNAAAHAVVYGGKIGKSRAAAARYAKSHAETIRFGKL